MEQGKQKTFSSLFWLKAVSASNNPGEKGGIVLSFCTII